MNNIPQQKLCELSAQYGETLYDDPRRCESLLRDLCAPEAYPKEISLIRQAQEQGIVQDLLNVKHHPASYKAMEAKWLKTLKEDYAIAEEASRWTIETWAKAVGFVPQSSTHNHASVTIDQFRTWFKSFIDGFTGNSKPSQQQFWTGTGVIAILLIIGFSIFVEQWQAAKQRQLEQQEAERREMQHQEAQRKATIDSAYRSLPCKVRLINPLLEASKKPDYVDPKSGTEYYGPLPPLPSSTYEATTILAIGDRYDGEFINNKWDGCGTYTYKDGRVYIGQFENNRFNGIGRLVLNGNDEYIGEFRDGKCQGDGLIIYSTGEIHKDVWQANRSQVGNLQCGL